MTKRLKGKACIVTGAGAGIGLAIVRAFAGQGATPRGKRRHRRAADSAVEVLRSAGRRPSRTTSHRDRRRGRSPARNCSGEFRASSRSG